ncbi:MAG: DNA adenine methylase [Blastocatellia bacterium]|jgi:adenine-specific DNA-methyltransferase
MNYIGSKYSLLPFLEDIFRQISDGTEKVFCDLFAGTGIVGRHFKTLGLKVIANDIQYYSYALNKAYLEIDQTPDFAAIRSALTTELKESESGLMTDPLEDFFQYLNRLPGQKGFISSNYGPAGNRYYYTEENAEKADALRLLIEEWKGGQLVTEPEYFYLITSLIEAMDRVANTASVYGAYLKKFKKSASRPMKLRPLQLVNHVAGCRVYNVDAGYLINTIDCDVLYLDPPYNHREYGANYHVLETIAKYDSPLLTGTTGMRDYDRSDFCKVKKAAKAFENIIRSARARHILVSYNDEGILPVEELQQLLALRGEPVIFRTEYNRFKADNGRQYKRDKTVEYVHYVRVVKSANPV